MLRITHDYLMVRVIMIVSLAGRCRKHNTTVLSRTGGGLVVEVRNGMARKRKTTHEEK